MKKFILLSLFISFNLFAAKTPTVKELLQLKLGQIVSIASEGENKSYSYELETKDKKLDSVLIEFTPTISSSEYIKKDSKGYCLVQGIGGDIHMNRFFFFPENENRRYEIIQKGEIRSILVKDMPQAKTNKKCSFSELLKLGIK